jgi:ABC-type tungstate transport system substrate-binding protein
MTWRWFAAVSALALLALALLFEPFARSDPLGGVGWFFLSVGVILGLIVLGMASFVIRALVRSRRAVRRGEEAERPFNPST